MDAFSPDVLNNISIRALAKKVIVEEDAQMTAVFPKETIASVEVYLKGGTILEGKSILPKGEPENPLSDEEVIAKFIDLAIYGEKTFEEANKIVETVMKLETELPLLLRLLR